MPKIIDLTQQTKRRLITLGHKAFMRFLRVIILWLIIDAVLWVLGPIVINGLAQATRTITEHMCPDCLKNDWISYANYYIAISMLVSTIITIVWCRNHRTVKRDAEYLRKILHSQNERLPAVDIDELVRRITGLKDPEEDIATYNETYGMLMANITPIVDFLNGDIKYGAILMVDAPWGAGKTTAIKIAVDQRRKRQGEQNALQRYIYESAFKYTGNTGDFGRDIVSALCDTVSELGLNVQSNFISIMQNIDFSASGLFPSLLKKIQRKPEDTLTTELVNGINTAYRKHIKKGRYPLDVVVILDDIDRLQGEDIIKALSLLSIMRRLDFVKIILPVDSHSIIYQLKKQCRIENPDKFIRKYLPEQNAVKLESGEEIVEQIVLRKIKGLQDNPPADGTEFCAAWAAIIIKLVSEKLHSSLDDEQSLNLQWLGRFEYTKIPSEKMPKISEFSCYSILRNSSNSIDHVVFNAHDSYGQKYKWPNSLKTDIRNFEDIILKLQRGDGIPVIQNFTEEEYDELIASWIFGFARQDWPQIGATLRDALDLILANNDIFSNLSLDRAIQFKQVLSQLFPKSAEMIWWASE